MKFFVKSFIFLFISFVVIIISLYVYAYLSPKLDLKTSGSLYLYDNQNGLIYQGSRSNEWANLEDISQYLIDAVVAVEDKNFYNHHGFDYPRIAKAMLTNIKKKAIVQGASTISQQYVKNLYLTFDKTWNRKIEEALLTLELETHYSKDEILEGYLNTINYGQGNMGIVNAASYYFNKKPKDLTLEEAIILAGIPKNPAGYNPVSNYDASVKRAWVVAKSMLNNKYIDEDTYNELIKRTPIEVGDVLLSTVGSYGHPAVVEDRRKFLFQRHIAYLKPDYEKIDSYYLYALLLTDLVQYQIDRHVKGIAQKTLNLKEIKNLKIPLPTIEEQRIFTAFFRETNISKVAINRCTVIIGKALQSEYHHVWGD